MASTVRRGRIVFTYEPGPWPLGILTGYDNGTRGFILEHVVAFKQACLIKLLKAGMAEAVRLDFNIIRFYIPRKFPKFRQLDIIGRALGFVKDAEDLDNIYYMRFIP